VTFAFRLRIAALLFLCASVRVVAAQPEAGQQIFSSTCAGCHGLDARGGEHAPDIATNQRVQRLSDADLGKVVRDGLVKNGMPAFGSTLNAAQIEAVVRYLRTLQGKGETVVVTGDPAAGRDLFFGRARCSSCHMVEGEGGFIAADLTGYGATRQPPDIRERIVNPTKFARPGRGSVHVSMKDGKTFSGVTRNEDNFSIQLQDLDGQFVFLDKREIARIEPAPEGLMPGDYGTSLSQTELDNLVSYLVHAVRRP
jgi:putative heme-binding domain-containing protein